MSFLAPLFLLGALAIAGPLIFHLVQRVTRERQRFSSLMFLRPAPPRLTHKRRFEHWLLLLLRALALALLALAFARPFFRDTSWKSASAEGGRRTIVLLDTSASMKRAGLWEAAREAASEAMREEGPNGEVALWTFGQGTKTIVDFAHWNQTAPEERLALAQGRLGAISPDWSGTHLAGALMAAAETLDDAGRQPSDDARRIVLISDLQEGSHLEGLGGYEWPKGIEVVVKPVAAKSRTNAGMHLAAEIGDSPRASENLRLRVVNAADSKTERFQIGWVEKAGASQFASAPPGREGGSQALDVYVPPGQSRVVTFPWPARESVTEAAPANPTDDQAGASIIQLRGDEEAFDNEIFVLRPATKRLKLLYLGTESPDDARQPLFFLRRAVPNNQNLVVEVEVATPDPGPAPATVGAAAMVMVAARPSAQAAQVIRDRMIGGKTVFCAIRSTDFATTLGQLAGLSDPPIEEVKPASYAMLADVDFRHPLFVPFADPRFSDFTKIRFWRYRRIDIAQWPEARVLARFDSRDPALIEVPVGQGRLLVFASSWSPEDSQFALSTKFAALLASLLDWTGQTALVPVQHLVGDTVPLSLPDASSKSATSPPAFTLVKPDGTTVAPGGTQIPGEHLAEPGHYRVIDPAPARKFAVNLDPAESRTAPMAIEELERWSVPLPQPAARKRPEVAREEVSTAVQTEGRQKLWRWILVAVLVILLAECLLSGATALRSADPKTA